MIIAKKKKRYDERCNRGWKKNRKENSNKIENDSHMEN